jgi:hypothetical protein
MRFRVCSSLVQLVFVGLLTWDRTRRLGEKWRTVCDVTSLSRDGIKMELKCHLRYCIYRHYFCKDYNYIKHHFLVSTSMTVSFHFTMSQNSMWGGFQCESALHVRFIRVQFESYPWSSCIWRTFKSDVIYVLCVNLKTRWSWTPN